MRSTVAAHWRAMTAADLPTVDKIADRLHADHPERPEVFAERLSLAPEGCLVLAGADGAVLGYAVTHPWTAAAPPALDSLLGALPARPDAWHLHDVALLEAARGQGHVRALLRRLPDLAAPRGISEATLVALAGVDALWRHLGFADHTPADGGVTLASYGAGAGFMARSLRP